MDLPHYYEKVDDDDVLQQAYEEFYKECLKIINMNVKLSSKVKLGEKEHEELKLELSEAQALLRQLKAHKVTLCEKLFLV